MELVEVVAPGKSWREMWLTKNAIHRAYTGEYMHPIRLDGASSEANLCVARRVTEMLISSTTLPLDGTMRDLARAFPGLLKLELEDYVCAASDILELLRISSLRELIICDNMSTEALVVETLPEHGLKGFTALQTLRLCQIDGADTCFPQDISLLVPSIMVCMHLSFGVAPGESAADDMLRAVRGAMALTITDLRFLVDLSEGFHSELDEFDNDKTRSRNGIKQLASNLSDRLLEALPSLKHLAVDECGW